MKIDEKRIIDKIVIKGKLSIKENKRFHLTFLSYLFPNKDGCRIVSQPNRLGDNSNRLVKQSTVQH